MQKAISQMQGVGDRAEGPEEEKPSVFHADVALAWPELLQGTEEPISCWGW